MIVRLLGGLDYSRYGCESCWLCAARGASRSRSLPGDGQCDTRLADFCTVSADLAARLDGYFREGGPANLANALRLGASLAGLGAPPDQGPVPVPRFGLHELPAAAAAEAPLGVLVFYRSHLLSGDIAPIESLSEALAKRGIGCRALYVDSLKSPDAAAFTAASCAPGGRAWC